MKKIFTAHLLLAIVYNSFSQSVGIGATTPTRAKLEVHGWCNY